MIHISQLQKLALSLPEAVESPHFEKSSFRVRKKIFATLDIPKMQLVVKFTEVDQSIFGKHDPETIYPVSGGWGKKGWTIIELKSVKLETLKAALETAYVNVAPRKLGDIVASKK